MRFAYFQTIIQYRIPIDDNGNAGQPEIIKKFTNSFKDSVSKKPKAKQLVLEESDDEQVEL